VLQFCVSFRFPAQLLQIESLFCLLDYDVPGSVLVLPVASVCVCVNCANIVWVKWTYNLGLIGP
jgi:hypothetical protein